MTRETKIGMLVGLAFIIVIGILLSDHMTSTTEPRPADQAMAGGDVRRGTTTPAPAVPTVETVIPPPSIATAPLPTQQELTARPPQPAVQNIQVGPGGAPAPTRDISIQQGSTPQPTQVVVGPGQAQVPAEQAPVIITPAPAQGAELAAAAPGGSSQQAFDQWVQRGNAGQPAQAESVVQPQPARPAGVPMTAVKQYKAEPGDNLHKIALKTMGTSTKATRDAILNANPALKANPDKIIVGRSYVIPPAGGAPAPAAPAAPAAVAHQPAAPSRPGGPIEVSSEEELNEAMRKVFGAADAATESPAPAVETATADGYRWYTVKENDTLWGIAAAHLGAGSRLHVIQELNKDLLKGSVTVHPGQKLRLPAKQVASTN